VHQVSLLANHASSRTCQNSRPAASIQLRSTAARPTCLVHREASQLFPRRFATHPTRIRNGFTPRRTPLLERAPIASFSDRVSPTGHGDVESS